MKRTYTIPLRRKYRNTQRNMRAKKAVSVTQQFLRKHMKADEVKLGSALNDHIWSRGIKNPPGKVTVTCEKTAEGIIYADLEGEVLQSEIDAQQQKEADKEEASTKKKPAKETKPEPTEEDTSTTVALEEVKGLGPSRIEALKEAGITDAHQLANTSTKDLSAVDGVGEATAEKILAAAKEATK